MDKPLSDIKKDGDGAQGEVKSPQVASPAAVPDSGDSKPGHHDFIEAGSSKAIMGSAIAPTAPVPEYDPELTEKNWEESKKNQRWDATPWGRGLIRLESRGVLGSMAFASAGWYITRGKGMEGYSKELSFSELNSAKPLQYIAKAVDSFVGTPIKYTAKILGSSEQEAENLVRFRPTRYYVDGIGGRSLGAEVVMISTDFSAASIGDAFGRDLANLADHHVKHDWIDDKGNIDFGKATKTLGKTLWRYVSYNGGEDWAVAIPYAYYMKGQRNAVNKMYPGFDLDFDRGLNGGSFKVNNEGKPTGNYLGAGILDFQGRFTAYNVGTLMYREGYNYIDGKLHGKNVFLYGDADSAENKKHGIVHDAGNLLKWGARSVVKGVIYMTPAVPFFSVFRTTQTKSKGIFINPDDESALGYKKAGAQGDKYDVLHADEIKYNYSGITHDTLPPVKFRSLQVNGKFHTISGAIKDHPLADSNFNPYKLGDGSPILNRIGAVQDRSRNFANQLNKSMLSGYFNPRSVDSYVNSMWAYTPYMYAKAETANLWDDGKMDASTERMIDGVAALNWKEFKSGANEVWRSILHKPLRNPAREAYAQKRIDEDASPADNLTEEQSKLRAMEEHDESQLSWRDRVIHATPPEKPKPEKKSSHAEQEAMRKALQDLQPPTNSIH